MLLNCWHEYKRSNKGTELPFNSQSCHPCWAPNLHTTLQVTPKRLYFSSPQNIQVPVTSEQMNPYCAKQTERDDTPSWKFTLETRAGCPGLEPTFQGFTNWLYGNGLENPNWMALSSMLQIWTQASYENTRMGKETEKPASTWVDRMRLMQFLYLWGKNAHKHQHSYQRTNQEGMPGIVCVVRRRVLHLLLSAGSWALGDGATGVKAEDKPWPLRSASSHG